MSEWRGNHPPPAPAAHAHITRELLGEIREFAILAICGVQERRQDEFFRGTHGLLQTLTPEVALALVDRIEKLAGRNLELIAVAQRYERQPQQFTPCDTGLSVRDGAWHRDPT